MYFSFIFFNIQFGRDVIISIKESSSVPTPFIAFFNESQSYSIGSVNKATIASSNLPRNSLFKSDIKSRPNAVLYASFIAILCWFVRFATIFIKAASSVPNPFIASRRA